MRQEADRSKHAKRRGEYDRLFRDKSNTMRVNDSETYTEDDIHSVITKVKRINSPVGSECRTQ